MVSPTFGYIVRLLVLPNLMSHGFLIGDVLEPKSGIEFTEEGDLIINNVRENVGGKYVCVRANEAGEAKGSAWLNILVKTKIVVPPMDTRVTLGHVANLPCRYTSAPSVEVRTKWYHDGVSVDRRSPQVSIRNDGTLTIEQVRATDAGTYTCEVLSEGGNDTRTAYLEIMDLPYPPKLVVAEKEPSVPKSAKISWTKNFDGNSPVTRFIVFKREVPPSGIENDLGLNWVVALTNVSALSSSVVISDLRPSTGYQFKVAAVNDVGEGPPSEPSEILVLPQEAPSGPPQGLVGSSRSNSEIMIQWEQPLEEDINGILKGYMVRYRLSGYKGSQWYHSNVTKDTQRNYLITGLITWKDYEIQVAAYNIKGVGVYSPSIKVKTKEGIPLAPPRNVTTRVLSSTSVLVEWKPPHPWMINGINQGYKVQAWRKHPDNSSAPQMSVRVAPSPYPDANESTTVKNLDKFTEYYVTVLCFTHPGDGKRSEPILIKTLEDGTFLNRFVEIFFCVYFYLGSNFMFILLNVNYQPYL
ncbi:Protein sidekick [Armadillidium vulgare]|nr:Protein sidekick [Armadillidium vulgare]